LKLTVISICSLLLMFSLSSVLYSISFATTKLSNTIRVPEDFPTIQSAINNAFAGDTILAANGTFNEHLTINKSVTLIGAGIGGTILNDTRTSTAIQIVADNITIKGFTIQNFRTGVIINQSQNIYITENQIMQIQTEGAVHIIKSRNITLTKNIITNNDPSPGVYMVESNRTSFFYNVISHNGGIGISLTDCMNFTAVNNQIEYNGGDAICSLSNGYNLYIVGNTFTSNEFRGIWASHSSGTVFHNNFVRNGKTVYGENAHTILSDFTWDDGYPSGGNYWSNYTGSDLYNGTNQNLFGSDGIGDVPSNIPEQGEQDKYPLMGNFTAQITTIDVQNYSINFVSNFLITNLYASRSEESLYFTINNSKQEGFCSITIPTSFMWCANKVQWAVTVNGVPTDRSIVEKGNCTYIYFTVAQGTHLAKITATNIVPEITFLALPFLLISILTTVLSAVHKFKKTRIKTPIHESFHLQIKTRINNSQN
jgi:parallel beta-helix repeat protein